MATKEVVYLSYAKAVLAHIELMRYLGETRHGVFDRSLVESALARPQQTAAYGSADLIAQAATLLYDIVQLVLAVESGERQPAEIENWLRARAVSLWAIAERGDNYRVETLSPKRSTSCIQ